MDANRLASVPVPARTSDSAPEATAVGRNEDHSVIPSAKPQLFRERRRSRAAGDARHEALDSVNRLLIRYEKTHEQLRLAEEKYRIMYEEAPVGFFQMCPAGRPLSVNRAMARICGYDSPQHLLAEIVNVGQQLLVVPEHLEGWTRTVDSHGIARGMEAEVFCRDGTRKWISLNLRMVRNEAGDLVH
jgi:PAS domain S-box-containing protein